MNATMRERVWAMKDAGKSEAETVQTLGISRKMVWHYLQRREVKMTEARREFAKAIMRGEAVKAAADCAGVNVHTGWRWLVPLGFERMYVTAAERQDLLARRRDAERAAMLPKIVDIEGRRYERIPGGLMKLVVSDETVAEIKAIKTEAAK